MACREAEIRQYTVVPNNVPQVLEFTHKASRIENGAGSWKDLYLPEAQGFAGQLDGSHENATGMTGRKER